MSPRRSSRLLLVIIVAGKIYVQPTDREAYLGESLQTIELARRAQGCLDFHLAADPIEPGRINIFEQWRTVADVEAFRGADQRMSRQRQLSTPPSSSITLLHPSDSDTRAPPPILTGDRGRSRL